MPYVNIPYSKLAGSIAVIVGKIQGNIAGKIVTKTAAMQKEFKAKGCPSREEMARMKAKHQGLTQNLGQINSRLSKFASIPSKLKPPLGGLKAALKIILTLPMPQGVGIPPGPPGGLIFGLPINITTKYADTMHLLKELIKQIDEQVEALVAVMETPALFSGATKNVLKRTDAAIKCCEVEAALQDELDKGSLTKENLKDLELMDDEEIFIFSKLGPVFVGGQDLDKITEDSSAAQSLQSDSEDDFLGLLIPDQDTNTLDTALEGGVGGGASLGTSGTATGAVRNTSNFNLGSGKPKGELTDLAKDLLKSGGISGAVDLEDERKKRDNARRILENALQKLETGLINVEPVGRVGAYVGEEVTIDGVTYRWNGSAWIKVGDPTDPLKDLKDRLRAILDTLRDFDKQSTVGNNKFTHIGANGEVYTLEILPDLEGPTIAPRHFAVAKDYEGTIVLRGPKSFSSSIDVLLDEIKFRIDNQLP